ncbi:MAG: hypothetical protein OXH04_23615, partial [Acidobacteria bacterium]|nr:hypothetical protein [Acidobacteriota bacterium]
MLRDVLFAVLAVFLVFVSLGLATSLTGARRRRQRQQQAIAARGQVVLAELPTGDGITFFTADDEAFHYGERRIPKDSIQAARVLINGAPIAASVAAGYTDTQATPADVVDDRPEGLSRDRWDVAIEAGGATVVVECGAIRERISQDLARQVFAAVKDVIEAR